MAPPHYEGIVNVSSGVEKPATYLSDDKGMSVLTVIEVPAVAYTNPVSCGESQWRGTYQNQEP